MFAAVSYLVSSSVAPRHTKNGLKDWRETETGEIEREREIWCVGEMKLFMLFLSKLNIMSLSLCTLSILYSTVYDDTGPQHKLLCSTVCHWGAPIFNYSCVICESHGAEMQTVTR